MRADSVNLWSIDVALTRKIVDKPQRTQRAKKMLMIGVSLRDKECNDWIRQKTKVTDIIMSISHLKCVARVKDNQWNNRLITWRQWIGRKERAKRIITWYNDIIKMMTKYTTELKNVLYAAFKITYYVYIFKNWQLLFLLNERNLWNLFLNYVLIDLVRQKTDI